MVRKEAVNMEALQAARAFADRILRTANADEARAVFNDFHALPDEISHRVWGIINYRKGRKLDARERASLDLVSAEVTLRSRDPMDEQISMRRPIGLVRTEE
jgi:hypothetical protein